MEIRHGTMTPTETEPLEPSKPQFTRLWMTPNPITILALSLWTHSRWTMVAHHTIHGGAGHRVRSHGHGTVHFRTIKPSLGIHWLPWFWAIPVAILWCGADIQYSLYFPQCFLLNMTWHAELYWKRKSLTGPVSMAEDTTKWTLAATIQAKTLAWVVCGDVWWIGLLSTNALWKRLEKTSFQGSWHWDSTISLCIPSNFYQMRRVSNLDTSWYYFAAVSVSGCVRYLGSQFLWKQIVNLRFDWMLPEAEPTGVFRKMVHSSAWLVTLEITMSRVVWSKRSAFNLGMGQYL